MIHAFVSNIVIPELNVIPAKAGIYFSSFPRKRESIYIDPPIKSEDDNKIESGMTKLDNGFTLIEILIFVTLISLIFITFSAVTAVSVRREALNQHKLMATHYAEELREWIRGQKEVNWDNFSTGKMGTWCFAAEPVSAWPSSGACADYSLDSLYKREVILLANAEETQVTAEITVSWHEGANVFSVPLKTIYSIYE